MKRVLALVGVTVATAVLAAPAAAEKPTILRNVQLVHVVQDPAACGDFGVVWRINITADVYTYFDTDGVRTRQVVHIREDNTIENTVTGLTLREGPDSLIQTTYFTEDGRFVDRIVAVGLQARVGNDLRDVGRVVLQPLGGGRFDLVFAAGPHPAREAADDGTLVDALPAFCEVLS